MKTLLSIVLTLLLSFGASAQNLKDILGKVTGNNTSDITSLISGVTGLISPVDIKGTWSYAGPAVTFKSENLLMKAGGAAAASTIKSKLEPYYKKAGIDKMTLEIEPDSTFTMKMRRGSISGNVTSSQEGKMTFKFKAAGMIKLGNMDASINRLEGNRLVLTFDVSKLMKVVNALATVSGNTTISSVNSLLQNYDGIQAGFELKKTSDYTTKNPNSTK